MKKTFSLLLITIILLSSSLIFNSQSVYGEQIEQTQHQTNKYINKMANEIYSELIINQKGTVEFILDEEVTGEDLSVAIDKAFSVSGSSYFDNLYGMFNVCRILKETGRDNNGQYIARVTFEYRSDNDQAYEYALSVVKSLELSNATDQERAVAYYNYILDHFEYDEELKCYSFMQCVNDRTFKTVCQGQSTLYYLLCNVSNEYYHGNIDCQILYSESHSWNAIRFSADSKYKQLDVTNSQYIHNGFSGKGYKIKDNYIYDNTQILDNLEHSSLLDHLFNMFR